MVNKCQGLDLPDFPEEPFIASTGGIVRYDEGVILETNVFNTESNPASNETYVLRLDENLNEIWTKVLEDPVNDFSRSVAVRNQEIIIGSNQNNQNITNNNFTSRLHLLVLDSEGEILDNFYYPADYSFLMGPADAMVVEDDGSLIIASREGEEYSINPSLSGINWQNCILKVNPVLDEVEWVQYFRSGSEGYPTNHFTYILKTLDGDYVASGTIIQGDSLDTGVIAKVNSNGDSLWMRHYRFIESHLSAYHVFNDMAQTPDGGFILVGEATNFSPDTLYPPPYQQGWIVKVDEHGCLVPGCHLFDSMEEPKSNLTILLQAYPNPASDFLHVFFRRQHQGRENWQFRAYDLQGREQAHFETDYSEMSFILEVQNWEAGLYFLEAMGPNGQREVVEQN